MVSETAEVMQLANTNDVQSLKRLFSKGLASPNDASCVTFQPILSVSYHLSFSILLLSLP